MLELPPPRSGPFATAGWARFAAALAVALATAAALGAPLPAAAAACCGTGPGLGGELGPAEQAALSVGLGGERLLGAWSSTRAFVGGEGSGGKLQLEGWLRLVNSVQVGARVPLVLNARTAGALSSNGGGPGDVELATRWDPLLPSAGSARPGLALTLGLAVPTGRPAEQSADLLAADVTGTGVFELRPGVALTLGEAGPLLATASAGVGLYPSSSVAGVEVARAPRLRLAASAGAVLKPELRLTLGLAHEREAGPAIEGSVAPRSERARSSAQLLLLYELSPRWSAAAGGSLDLPLDGAGRNEPAAATVTLGLRRAFLGS